MVNQPAVTIGIPVFNEERYIRETVMSAVNQTYGNLQVIVSDNCSTDSTCSILEELEKKYPRVRLIRQSSNIGAIKNFESPRALADSKYFMWLGAHDLIRPSYIEECVMFLEANPETVLVYTGGHSIDTDGHAGEPLEGDYDTGGLKKHERMLKVVRNMNNGYLIHGLFRTIIVKKLPFENVFGTDFLLVMLATLEGHISRIDYPGFQRRIVRKETHTEQVKRHEEYGMFKRSAVNPYSIFAARLFHHICKYPGLSWIRKLGMIRKIKSILEERFGVNWPEVLRLMRGK